MENTTKLYYLQYSNDIAIQLYVIKFVSDLRQARIKIEMVDKIKPYIYCILLPTKLVLPIKHS
jgi:hypothetical protein